MATRRHTQRRPVRGPVGASAPAGRATPRPAVGPTTTYLFGIRDPALGAAVNLAVGLVGWAAVIWVFLAYLGVV